MSIIIAAFAGTGKTTFAARHPDDVVDFVSMPYKYHLPKVDNALESCKANPDYEMQLDWPYNYVKAIKEYPDKEKILLIPSDYLVLSLLRKEDIRYILCYPVREAKEEYRKRFIDRGNTEDFLSVFIDRWDGFMDSLERDPAVSRYVMQPEQYIGDVIAVLNVFVAETLEFGTSIKISDRLSVSDDDGKPLESGEEDMQFTYSVGPEVPGGKLLGSMLSEVPKYWSNGPEPPDDEDYIMRASFSFHCVTTDNAALETLRRLGLLGKYLYIPDWKPREPGEVTAYLAGREDGISVDGNVITFGSEPLDRESMELLCMLDLLDKPLGGWMDDCDIGITEECEQNEEETTMSIDPKDLIHFFEQVAKDPMYAVAPFLYKQTWLTDLLEAYAEDPRRTFTPVPTDDPMINLFLYGKIDFDETYPEAKELGAGSEEWLKLQGEFRVKYDGDARYSSWHTRTNDPDEPLRADTMLSYYTPYKEMLKRSTGKTYHKSGKPFDELIAKRNEPGYKEVNEKFRDFATLYHTMGNFMLLPDRDMNNARYQCSQDRIDKSLYECFPGGALARYFGDSEEEQLAGLTKWVKEEKLDILFKGGVIERDNIIPLNPGNPFVRYEDMTDDELDEFVRMSGWLILARGKAIWGEVMEAAIEDDIRREDYFRRLEEDPELKADYDRRMAEVNKEVDEALAGLKEELGDGWDRDRK